MTLTRIAVSAAIAGVLLANAVLLTLILSAGVPGDIASGIFFLAIVNGVAWIVQFGATLWRLL